MSEVPLIRIHYADDDEQAVVGATPNLAAWRGAHSLGRARAMIGAELRAAHGTPRAGGTSRETHPQSLPAARHRAVLTPCAPDPRRPNYAGPRVGPFS